MRPPNPIEHIGLAFFGRVSASISHEIKNTLAIINENAGLLEDLALLAQQGVPLSSERLQRLSNAIRKQVGRSDQIVKKMNRFAHSTDQAVQPVDLYQTLVFMTELCDRLTAMHQVTVTVAPPGKPVIVTTGLFHLEHLIWGCIDFMAGEAKAGDTVELSLQPTASGAELRLAGLGALKSPTPDIFPADTAAVLQEVLQVTLDLDAEKGEIRIQIPQSIR